MKILATALFCVVLLLSGSSKATNKDFWHSRSEMSDQQALVNYPAPLFTIKKTILYDSEKEENLCDIVWRIPFFLRSPVDMMVARVCGYLYPNQSYNNNPGLILKAEEIAFNEYMEKGSHDFCNREIKVGRKFPYFQEDNQHSHFPLTDPSLFVCKNKGSEIRYSILRLDIIS